MALFVFSLHTKAECKMTTQNDYTESEIVTIDLIEGGTLHRKIVELDIESSDIKKIVVSGVINSNDLKFIRSLTSLESIDMSGITKMETGTEPYFETSWSNYGGGESAVVCYLAEKETIKNSKKDLLHQYYTTEYYSPNMHYAFRGLENLKEIVLPYIMTTLGIGIFAKSSVVHVVLPDNVTKIESGAFNLCSSLQYVDGLEHVSNIVGGLPPVPARASRDSKYGGTFGYCSNFVGNSTEHKLDLSHLDSIPNRVFPGCSMLTDVIFSPSLYFIGLQAFYKSGLQSFTSASVNTIESEAFGSCPSLASISLFAVDVIGSRAFGDCSSLNKVVLPASVHRLYADSFEKTPFQDNLPVVNGVSYMGNMAIVQQEEKTELNIREGTTYIVENFKTINPQIITSVTLPSSLRRIGREAMSNMSLASLALPEGLEEMDYNNLQSLEEISLPSTIQSISISLENVSKLTIPESMEFISANCKSLKRLTFNARHIKSFSLSWPLQEKLTVGPKVNYLPDNIGNNVYVAQFDQRNPSDTLYIGSAFHNNANLTSVSLPEGVTTIGANAFNSCTGLTSINIPSSVTSIGQSAFQNCPNMTSITIPDNVTSVAQSAFQDCTGLTSINIPSSVTSIGQSAFEGCTNLASITFPSNVTFVGYKAFYNTAWYENQPDGLIYIGKVAYRYKGDMPSGYEMVIKEGTLGICSIAFSSCYGLNTIIIPNSITYIGESAFTDCVNMKSIAIPNSVTSISNSTFYRCKSLKSVNIPNSVTYIGSSAFNHCESLESITIPNSVTSIDGSAFSNSGLKTITIPSSVTSISRGMFDSCSKLSTVTIPSSVTFIGYRAFQGCRLSSITIPNSVSYIEDGAFSGCAYLTEIYSEIGCNDVNNIFSIDTDVFNSSYQTATLYVPIGTKAVYSTTDGWKEFKNIQEFDPLAISEPMVDNHSRRHGAIYTLSGQRIKTQRKGIIVVDGKKVVIR